MTDMKRVTISLPDSKGAGTAEGRPLRALLILEIVRRLLEAGLSAKEHEKGA